MDNVALLVPIFVPLSFFALVFGIVYLRNRERMAMIERGMDPRLQIENTTPRNYVLTVGMLMIGSGLGLFIANMIEWSLRINDPEAIYFGSIAFFGGLGLLGAYLIDKKASAKQ